MGVGLIITACLLSVPLATYAAVYWYLYSKALVPDGLGLTEEDLEILNECMRSQ